MNQGLNAGVPMRATTSTFKPAERAGIVLGPEMLFAHQKALQKQALQAEAKAEKKKESAQ